MVETGQDDVFKKSKDSFFAILVIPVIFLSIIFFLALYSSFANKDFEINNLHASVVVPRIISSSNCFAFEDGMVKPGIIDINKFSSERLSRCIDTRNINFGVRAILKYGDKTKEAVSNELMVNREFLCHEDICMNKKYFVLVKDGDELKEGYLDILTVDLT